MLQLPVRRATGRAGRRAAVVRATATPQESAELSEKLAKLENIDSLESEEKREIRDILKRPYKYGFTSAVESVAIPKGLDEDTVRLISAKKEEPEWLLDFRLRAYRKWLTMKEPEWSDNQCAPRPLIPSALATRAKPSARKDMWPLFTKINRHSRREKT